jgi:hypothetical protein
MKKTIQFACLGAAVLLSQGFLAAQNGPPQGGRGRRPLARDLDNPSGLVIQPGTGDILVAEHRGVFRLHREEPAEGQRWAPRTKTAEISGYSTDIYGKGPMYDIGPLGLAWLDAEHLIVGDGSRKDGAELVRVYKVGSAALGTPAGEDSAAFTLGPIVGGDLSAMGEGNFYGIAVTAGAIFVTCNGDDTKGWISKAAIVDGKPGELVPFIATKEAVGVDAPVAITVNGDGDLVVGQMGEVNVAGDSLLTVYNPETGELKAKYTTGLSDIAGLAYSPVSGKLYAVDYAWADSTQGGLFELTVSGETCTATKVRELDKPTAIVFDDEGNAYITGFGTAEEGSETKPGYIVRVRAETLAGEDRN